MVSPIVLARDASHQNCSSPTRGLFRFPRLASWDRRCLSRRLDIEAIAGRPFALYLYNTAGRGSALPESVLPRKFSKVQA